MITIKITYLILMVIILPITGVLIWKILNYVSKERNNLIYCHYTVISKATDKIYECYAIRQKNNIIECKIWNMYSKKYEWYPICHFTFYQ